MDGAPHDAPGPGPHALRTRFHQRLAAVDADVARFHERLGDHAVHIAERIHHIASQPASSPAAPRR